MEPSFEQYCYSNCIVRFMTEITPDVTDAVQEEEIETPKQVDELNQTTDINLNGIGLKK